MRSIQLSILALLVIAFPSAGKNVRVRGYVTEVQSPTSFEIDDYRVMRDESLVLDFEKEDENTEDLPKDIRVGTELEVKGEYDQNTHELKAQSIKVFATDLRKLRPRTALVEQMPDMKKVGTRWEGTFRVDGQTLVVDEATEVSIVPNNSQKKAIKRQEKGRKAAAKKDEDDESEGDPDLQAITKLDDIHRNMFVSYSGRRMETGQIHATKLVFKDNEMTKGEARLWKSLKPKEKSFRGTSPGELRIGAQKYKTVPDAALQKYVEDVGASLIPPVQRDLPSSDDTKIPFSFHLVENKVPNASAYPNGVVIVHTGLFSVLENEAQLAFVLGHEISHATQQHTLRQLEFHKKKRMALQIGMAVAAARGAYNVRDVLALTSAAITNGYQRYLENQADREGMEYMLNAGYDPREAPRAWKAMSLKLGDSPTNFFWSTHDNNTTRRSYLMAELRTNYQGVDFSSKKKDSTQFETARNTMLQQFGQKRIKVKH